MTAYRASQTSIVEDLKNLLRDRYRSGFPVFKELLQNADDAGATRLVIKGSEGFPEATNPLLRAPALIVANDGVVEPEHFEAMERSSGGSKAAEAGTVGRFGLGQKAVFHLCDAFVAQGWIAGDDTGPRQKIINPWELIPGATEAGSTWKEVDPSDVPLLHRWFEKHGFTRKGLLLVLPLRTSLLSPGGGFALTEARWTIATALGEISGSDQLAATLCCLRNLRVLELEDAWGTSQRFEIDGSGGRLSTATARRSNGAIGGRVGQNGDGGTRFIGRERWSDTGDAARLKAADDWPHTFDLREQRQPQKAEPHGAALLCRTPTQDASGALRIHWTVFLPVHDEAEVLPLPPSLGRIDLLLHGYFFVDSARTSIRFGEGSTDRIEDRWNRALRDEATLPLVLDVLADGLARLFASDVERRTFVDALDERSGWWREYRGQICGDRALVHAWDGEGPASWRIAPIERLRPMPGGAGIDQLARTFPGITQWLRERGIALALGPVLAARSPSWTDEELASLIALAGAAGFQRQAAAETLALLMDVARSSFGPLAELALAEALQDAILDAVTPIRAADAIIRQLVSLVPPERVFRLPASAKNRQVMKALAEGGARVPVRAEWRDDDGERLSDTAAIDLLTAVAPFVGHKTAGEEAAAIISQIFKRGPTLRALAANARARDLPILPATRVLDLADVTLTIAQAEEFGAAGCLFNAQPNQLLQILAEAVLEPTVYRVRWPGDADGLALQTSARNALLRPLTRAVRFGAAHARGVLAGRLSDLADLDTLRSLCAGIPQLPRSVQLFELDRMPSGLLPLIHALHVERTNDILVDPAAAKPLSDPDKQRLGIERLDPAQLGRWLSEACRLGALPDLPDEVAQALLVSNIDPDVLAPLPIHLDQNKVRVALADGIFQAAPGAVPVSLLPIVHVLVPWNDDRVEQAQRRLVPRWNPTAQIDVALSSRKPADHLQAIVQALSHPDTHLASLATRLRRTPWIPIGDVGHEPQGVLDLDQATDAALRRLIGEARAFPTPLDLPVALRDTAVLDVLRQHAILPSRRESLEMAGALARELGACGCLVDPVRHFDDLAALARHHVDLALPGWPLLAAALQGGADQEAILALARGLVAQPPATMLLQHLNALAAAIVPGQAGEAARRIHRAVFMAHVAALRDGAFLTAGLLLPSSAGTMRLSQDLALAATGVDRAYLLAPDYAEALRAERDDIQMPISDARLQAPEESFAEGLARRLEPWRNVATSEAVMFVLALLGRNAPIQALAESWEQQRSFSRICDDVDRLGPDLELLTPFAERLAEIRFEIAPSDGTLVEALSAAGTLCTVPLDTTNSTWLVDVVRLPTYRDEPGGPLWHPFRLSIADVNATDEDDARRYFEQFVNKLAPVLGVLFADKRSLLTDAVARCFETDQAALAETEAELRRVIDDRLRGLKVQGAVKEALREFDRCQHRDSKAGARLWEFVRSEAAAPEMLSAVREKIAAMGYADDRVLFELFQNADDALRHWSGSSAGRFRVEARRGPDGTIENLRVIHWGRPVNHLGEDREAGLQNDYSRDFASMLAIGQSGKEGDHQTGRFGLGFKTVHMLSDAPCLASGRISAKIKGGMVPIPWDEGRRHAAAYARRGEQPTLIDLPIPRERAAAATRAFDAFRDAAPWLPTVAQRVRRIELADDQTGEKVLECRGRPVAGQVDLVEMGTGRRAFRFHLADGFCLLLALGQAGPEAIREVPSLWHLVPLGEEERRSHWLLDGRFRVNPGRTHIIGSAEEKQSQFAALAESFGAGLVGLFDAVDGDWTNFAAAAGLDPEARELFWSKLVDLLTYDLRQEPEVSLHRDGGLGRLLAERALVPLSAGGMAVAGAIRWRRAGALADDVWFSQVCQWPSFLAIANAVVDEERGHVLAALGLGLPPPLTLAALIGRMLEGDVIGPSDASVLGGVITAENFESLPFEERSGLLHLLGAAAFIAEDGSAQPIGQLAFPQRADDDERARAAFAPPQGRLSSDYDPSAVALAEIARRQTGQNQYVWRTWARLADEPEKQEAFLRFLLRIDRPMAQFLYEGAGWPPSLGDLPLSPLVRDWTPDDRNYLLAQLGVFAGGAFGPESPEPVQPDLLHPNPQLALEAIADWWEARAPEFRAVYDRAAYPEGFEPSRLLDSDDDEAWFTMLALATFQTLGRTQPEQSRAFVESALRGGWWRELAQARGDGDLEPWLARLRAWSEPWETVDFMTWRRCLVDLYSVARYLPEYRRIFRSLPRIVAHEGDVAMRELLRPGTSQIAARMGIVAAPLAQSVGIGANWMIRELSRAGVFDEEQQMQLAPYGWSTTRRVRSLFQRIGAGEPAHGVDQGRRLYDYVAHHLGADRARFLGDLDLPFQILTTRQHRGTLMGILADADAPTWGLDIEDEDG